MIPNDYVEKRRRTKQGKTVTNKVVTSASNTEYAICGKLGAGGVGVVYHAVRLKDKKRLVFKEYPPKPEKRQIHLRIKKNIKSLIKQPLTESDGTPLRSFIPPLDIVELPASGGFGYIMPLLDTKTYRSVLKLWHPDTYPDMDMLCTACLNIAKFFQRVHSRGLCYKDISEGNVYINGATGEAAIIDCDNISLQKVQCILGTEGYMAPEVYVTKTPDRFTDYFSMAVLFYRLFIGGFPLDGKRTQAYLLKNNTGVSKAAPVIYGSMALFAFDPNDKSNSIHGLVDPINKNLYSIMEKRWNRLPDALKKAFIKTFSTGLKNEDRHLRTDDRTWIKVFESLLNSGMVKCRCGRTNLGETNKRVNCIYCSTPLQKIVPAPKELTEVEFRVKRDIAPTNSIIIAKRKQTLPGAKVYRGLNNGWMRIEYSKKRNALSAVNCSQYSWSVSNAGVKSVCDPGKRVVLKKDLVITVLKRRLQLKVTDVR